MSETGDQQQQQQQQQQHDQEQQVAQLADLSSELRELGRQLEQAVRSAVHSEPAKTLQQDISTGLKEIGGQLQMALKSIQENPNVQNWSERGQHVVDHMQDNRIIKEFQETLTSGIARLNEQLASFTERMQKERMDSATEKVTYPPIQSIPVEAQDEPATGATIRLDTESDTNAQS